MVFVCLISITCCHKQQSCLLPLQKSWNVTVNFSLVIFSPVYHVNLMISFFISHIILIFDIFKPKRATAFNLVFLVTNTDWLSSLYEGLTWVSVTNEVRPWTRIPDLFYYVLAISFHPKSFRSSFLNPGMSFQLSLLASSGPSMKQCFQNYFWKA